MLFSLVSSCQVVKFSADGRPCNDNGGCLPGYSCNVATLLCEVERAMKADPRESDYACVTNSAFVDSATFSSVGVTSLPVTGPFPGPGGHKAHTPRCPGP